MKYKGRIKRVGNYFQASTDELPCVTTAASKEEAVEKLKKEILFYLQSCPCDQIPESAVELEIDPLESTEGRDKVKEQIR